MLGHCAEKAFWFYFSFIKILVCNSTFLEINTDTNKKHLTLKEYLNSLENLLERKGCLPSRPINHEVFKRRRLHI